MTLKWNRKHVLAFAYRKQMKMTKQKETTATITTTREFTKNERLLEFSKNEATQIQTF